MDFRKKRIIVTDDDQLLLIQLCRLLKKMGLNSIPAENGLELIKLVNIQMPDLILMDIIMPYLNGLDTINYLKGNPSMHKIPIIAMSTDTSPKTAEAIAKSGAYDFLPKPLDIKRLHQLFEEVLFGDSESKRYCLRTPYHGRISLSVDDRETSHHTKSISERGAFVVTPEPLPIGTRVIVALEVKEKTLTFHGDVIYHYGLHDEENNIPPGMAIKFIEGASEDFERLHELIKEQLTLGLNKFNKDSFV